MAPNYHTNVDIRERNVSPTLERSSKRSSKGRSSYFRTARYTRYTKQSAKIYRRKSCRTIPRTPNSPMRAKLKVIWPILRRLAGGRKSLRRQGDRNLEDIRTEKERKFQDCEADDSGRESKYSRKRTDRWDDEEGRSKLRKVQKPATPNLSDVQRSNFRIRLYYQLNVVKRVNEKPSYLYSLPYERSNFNGYSSVTRLKGKHHFVVERSKPIAIDARRISDFHFGTCDRKLRAGKTSQSDKGSDNEDVFVLDIEPIPRSCI